MVTFDLAKADQLAYLNVHSELKNIDFSESIARRKQIDKPLPSNTFVAEFDNDDFDRSSEVCAYVGDEINRILKGYKVVGKYFVAARRRWAWKMARAG